MDAENVVDGGIRHRGYLVLEALEKMNITRPDAPKGFVTRIAEENGWTIERAEAADREYRRFLMLAWSTDEMVVPSRDVDAAWHEHLLHTRHYWDATCRDILGKRFHHDPGDGSPVDAATHAAGYERTLALYQEVFGEPAPMDVWPRGCTCAPAARPQEVELAMPAWTILAAASVAMLVITRGVMGHMAAAGLAVLAVIAAIARSQGRAASSRGGAYRDHGSTYRPRAATPSPVSMAKARTASPSGSRSTSSSASQRRRDEASRSSDDAGMAALWMSDAGNTSTASAHAASTACAPSPSHSSHSTHCDTGSSHSSHGHGSCGSSSSSSHSSCGSSSSSSSSSCGSSSSSCGGSSCGGGGCGGS